MDAIETTAAVTQDAMKGRNVSGRTWKVKAQKRASSLIKTKANNHSTTWEAKVVERNSRQLYKELEKELRETKRKEIVLRKERRLENEKRRAENEYKTVQKAAQNLNINRLGTTLKALSKKQLRQIKKTRMNTKTGVIEYVPMYAK